MRMLRLHHYGAEILVNPAYIETVFPSTSEGIGAYVYVSGEEGPLHIDEDLETIDRKIALS